MANASKRKASLWHGYLDAGARSSPVLRDARLDTGNPQTVYLFNLVRGEILEYQREIVEKKLRELKAAETGLIAELDAGYKKARRNFKARAASIRNIAERAATAFREKKDYSEDSDDSLDDSDMWLDAEEA